MKLKYLCIWESTDGRFGGINYKGIKYYNNLIDALIRKGNIYSPFFLIFSLVSNEALNIYRDLTSKITMFHVHVYRDYTICDVEPFRLSSRTREPVQKLVKLRDAVSL